MAGRITKLFIGLTIASALILYHPAGSLGAESIFGFSFKDLRGPLFDTGKSSVGAADDFMLRGEYSSISLPVSDIAGKGTESSSSWNEIDYKNFRFSFNSLLAEPSLDRNYHRLVPDSQLDPSQMVPSLFQGSYMDSLQSLGKIIEPQIKIEIRF